MQLTLVFLPVPSKRQTARKSARQILSTRPHQLKNGASSCSTIWKKKHTHKKKKGGQSHLIQSHKIQLYVLRVLSSPTSLFNASTSTPAKPRVYLEACAMPMPVRVRLTHHVNKFQPRAGLLNRPRHPDVLVS